MRTHNFTLACGLVDVHPKTYRYASKRSGDEGLRKRLWELTSQRRRFGYRRLGLMLERQGIKRYAEKLYRLYRWSCCRVAICAGRPTSWRTRCVSGRRFRIPTLVDDSTRECPGLVVDTSLTGLRTARQPRNNTNGAAACVRLPLSMSAEFVEDF
jgi:putative transposase